MKQGKGSQSFAKRIHWSQQTHSSNNTREDSIHRHHQTANIDIRLFIFFATEDGEVLYRQQKQNQELTAAQILNFLLKNSAVATGQEKVCFHFNPKERQCQRIFKLAHQTTTPFRYDLNQIPCDYTVEVRHRIKGLDLTDRGPDELWIKVHDIVQEIGIKTITKKKKCKKSKMVL